MFGPLLFEQDKIVFLGTFSFPTHYSIIIIIIIYMLPFSNSL